MIRSILFHTLLSVLILMGSVGNAFAASSVGEKPDLGVYDFDAATPYPTGVSLSPISLVSGAEIILGPGATTASDGATLFYYWQCWKGTLQAVNGNTAHVRYRAPLTAVNTSDRIRLWVGSTSGKVFRATINVSVTGSVLAPQGGNNFDFGGQPPGQLSASYNSAASNFTVNYSLGATVTRAWILASTNGSTFSIVSTIDPVTAANRSGVRLVTVPGSGSATQVFFRLRTQIGSATAEEGAGISVGYT